MMEMFIQYLFDYKFVETLLKTIVMNKMKWQ